LTVALSLYKEKDITRDLLAGRTVGVVGFGNQGRAHALNLRDSGVSVVLALRGDSPSRDEAVREGLSCVEPGDVPEASHVISILIPDEEIGPFWREHLKGRISDEHALCFAHGFAYHYGQVDAPASSDVFLVAPLGPGRLLRELYTSGRGLPAYVAVGNDASGHARETALSYSKALGCARAGVVPTTFAEETEVDLFGEQAVLCGGLAWLVTRAFEVLVEGGFSPEIAYMECVNQLETLAALISKEGLDGMRTRISGTALYGELTRGPAIIDEGVRESMREVLRQVTSGEFAREWIAESSGGRKRLGALRAEADGHKVVETGRIIRKALPER
jgi:ketol-acid reductoisomerase